MWLKVILLLRSICFHAEVELEQTVTVAGLAAPLTHPVSECNPLVSGLTPLPLLEWNHVILPLLKCTLGYSTLCIDCVYPNRSDWGQYLWVFPSGACDQAAFLNQSITVWRQHDIREDFKTTKGLSACVFYLESCHPLVGTLHRPHFPSHP